MAADTTPQDRAIAVLHEKFQGDSEMIGRGPSVLRHLTAIKTTGPDLLDWQKLTLGEIVDCLAEAGLLVPSHLTHSLCLEWDDTCEGFTIVSDGAEARRVVALADTVRQVMQERDARETRVAESVHPGEILREELKVRGLTQSKCAEMAGRSVRVINQIIKGKKSITAGTALDLERALGVGAGFWVRLQAEHDLAVARQRRAVPR